MTRLSPYDKVRVPIDTIERATSSSWLVWQGEVEGWLPKRYSELCGGYIVTERWLADSKGFECSEEVGARLESEEVANKTDQESV